MKYMPRELAERAMAHGYEVLRALYKDVGPMPVDSVTEDFAFSYASSWWKGWSDRGSR